MQGAPVRPDSIRQARSWPGSKPSRHSSSAEPVSCSTFRPSTCSGDSLRTPFAPRHPRRHRPGGLGRPRPASRRLVTVEREPGLGNGIRYEVGILRQAFVGVQVEQSDQWLRLSCPWELPLGAGRESRVRWGYRHRLDSSGPVPAPSNSCLMARPFYGRHHLCRA